MPWRSEYCFEPRLSRRHRARYVPLDPQNGKTRAKMKTQALAQIPETKQAGGPVARLSDVVKVYKEGDVEVPAIKGITFDVPRQRFSMIVGPSGSGKTTLLNLIGCLDKPTQGTIFVGGQDVGALNDNAIQISAQSALDSFFRTSA